MTVAPASAAPSAATEGWTPLEELGVLAVRGTDCLRFLQGYATCDMASLDGGRVLRGAFCNQKGRMLTSFRALRALPEAAAATTPDSTVWLVMHRDLVAAAQAMLARYIVFSKAALEQPSLRLFGLLGDAALQSVVSLGLEVPEPGRVSGETVRCARLDTGRALIVAPAEAAGDVEARLDATALARLAAHSWTAHAIARGVAEVLPETQLTHTPQALAFPETDGVSFSKGCYLGQEIVARLQYRGRSKTQLFRLGGDVSCTAPAGTVVIDADGRSVGETATPAVAGCDRATELLAVLRSDARPPFSLTGDAGEPNAAGFEALALPYAIPSGESEG